MCDVVLQDLEGFSSSEAQLAVSSSVDYANNSNLESEDFIERVQEIQELQQRHGVYLT